MGGKVLGIGGGKIGEKEKGELCFGPSWAQKLTNGPSN